MGSKNISPPDALVKLDLAGDDAPGGAVVANLRSVVPRGYIDGLTLSNGTDATNDIDIAAGEAADTTTKAPIALASALGKRLDAAWAAGGTPAAPAGGLDTGSIANTTYHVWLIGKTDGTVDALFSASATAPTMPSGYTLKRRIGSRRRIAGAWQVFRQDGDMVMLDPALNEFSDNNPGNSSHTKTLASVPTGIVVRPVMKWRHSDYTSRQTYLRIFTLGMTDPATISGIWTSLWDGLGTQITAVDHVQTDTSAQVGYRFESGTAVYDVNQYVGCVVHGWIDSRGRDA